jgi:hypothetical protein
MGGNFVRDGILLQGNSDHLAFRAFPAFADGVSHFTGLA